MHSDASIDESAGGTAVSYGQSVRVVAGCALLIFLLVMEVFSPLRSWWGATLVAVLCWDAFLYIGLPLLAFARRISLPSLNVLLAIDAFAPAFSNMMTGRSDGMTTVGIYHPYPSDGLADLAIEVVNSSIVSFPLALWHTSIFGLGMLQPKSRGEEIRNSPAGLALLKWGFVPLCAAFLIAAAVPLQSAGDPPLREAAAFQAAVLLTTLFAIPLWALVCFRFRHALTLIILADSCLPFFGKRSREPPPIWVQLEYAGVLFGVDCVQYCGCPSSALWRGRLL